MRRKTQKIIILHPKVLERWLVGLLVGGVRNLAGFLVLASRSLEPNPLKHEPGREEQWSDSYAFVFCPLSCRIHHQKGCPKLEGNISLLTPGLMCCSCLNRVRLAILIKVVLNKWLAHRTHFGWRLSCLLSYLGLYWLN